MHPNNKHQLPLIAIMRQYLVGFVTQQTKFPFVAIVHDVAITNHSANIICEYAKRYHYLSHPIYETEGQNSKGSLGRIMNTAIDTTGAKTYTLRCARRQIQNYPEQTPKTSGNRTASHIILLYAKRRYTVWQTISAAYTTIFQK